MLYEILKFPTVSDDRGNLTYINNLEQIPFEIKRMFTVDSVPAGAVRGGHAHHQLQEVLIPIYGRFIAYLSDGKTSEEVEMINPRTGLLLYPHIWREIKGYTKGAICLSLCSMTFDESDYIHTWEEFRKIYG